MDAPHPAGPGQPRGLLRRHHDVFIIGKNINIHSGHLLCRVQNILSGGIHGLPAAHDLLDAQITEQLLHAVAGRHRHKARRQRRVYLRRLGSRRFLLLLYAGYLRLVLLYHILNLQLGQHAVGPGLFQRQARVGGVHMALDDLIIVHHHYAVADGFQISPQPGGVMLGVVPHHQELGAVGVVDVHFLHLASGVHHSGSLLSGGGSGITGNTGHHALPGKDLPHPLQDVHQSLPAGIHYTGLFQHRQLLRGLGQRLLGILDDQIPYLQRLHGVGQGGPALFGSHSCHRQDGPLGGLHNGLVGGRHTDLQRFHQIGGAGFAFVL